MHLVYVIGQVLGDGQNGVRELDHTLSGHDPQRLGGQLDQLRIDTAERLAVQVLGDGPKCVGQLRIDLDPLGRQALTGLGGISLVGEPRCLRPL